MCSHEILELGFHLSQQVLGHFRQIPFKSARSVCLRPGPFCPPDLWRLCAGHLAGSRGGAAGGQPWLRHPREPEFWSQAAWTKSQHHHFLTLRKLLASSNFLLTPLQNRGSPRRVIRTSQWQKMLGPEPGMSDALCASGSCSLTGEALCCCCILSLEIGDSFCPWLCLSFLSCEGDHGPLNIKPRMENGSTPTQGTLCQIAPASFNRSLSSQNFFSSLDQITDQHWELMNSVDVFTCICGTKNSKKIHANKSNFLKEQNHHKGVLLLSIWCLHIS